MYIHEELILNGFDFSPRALKFWESLDFQQQDTLQEIFNDMDGEYSINDIDDWFIHDRDWICELLGFHGYDNFLENMEVWSDDEY